MLGGCRQQHQSSRMMTHYTAVGFAIQVANGGVGGGGEVVEVNSGSLNDRLQRVSRISRGSSSISNSSNKAPVKKEKKRQPVALALC